MQWIKDNIPHILRNKWFFLFSLTLIWILAAIVVNPVGEFPLNDDWAYARNVYYLAVKGIFTSDNWTAMTLIAQTFWGTLFCKIFGFSFTVLRMSVLFTGWLGLIAFFLVIRKMVMNNVHAFFYSLVLAFNPLYFNLSYTYMTEVPFLACMIAALYFSYRYYETPKIKYLLLTSCFALFATMIRQIGIEISLALIGTTLLSGKIRMKHLLLQIFFAGIIVLILYGFIFYLKIKNCLPYNFGSFSDLFKTITITKFIRNLTFRSSILLFYSGLLLLPLVTFTLPSYIKRVKPIFRWTGVAVSVLFALPVIQNITRVPIGNVINNAGLGPKLVKDYYYNWTSRHPVVSPLTVHIIYAIGMLGVVLLIFVFFLMVSNLKTTNRTTPSGRIKIQLLLMIGGYFVFILLFSSFFDRYILPVIVFLGILLASNEIKIQRWNLALSFLLFLCFTSFSVLATHDYLSFNRARWTGLRSLMSKGISPHHIDGGFEFNCWYKTGPFNEEKQGIGNKSWWCVDDDTYMLSIGRMKGYKEIAAYKYNSYLTLAKDSVLVLERIPMCSNTVGVKYQDSTVISCGAEALSRDGSHFLSNISGIEFGDTRARTVSVTHSGKYAILLDTIHPYGFTITFRGVEHCEKFHVSIWCRDNSDHKAGIVVRASNTDWLYVWEHLPRKRAGDWELLEATVPIKLDSPSSEVSVIIWNTGKQKVIFDDLKIVRYQPPVF